MQLPLQITFRHMDSSPAVEARIRQKVGELERFFDRIISCRVIVECAHPRRRQGNLFRVRVDLKVPGAAIVVGRDPALRHAHEDVYVAIRDSFDAARRLLEDRVHEGRGEVKTHSVPEHGKVSRLLPERDCGFLVSADGKEIYFHKNSVADDLYGRLEIGDEVRFVAQERESAEGPQASTVVPLGKHHLPPVETMRS